MLPSSSPAATLCRQFSLSEIKSATNNFSVHRFIGKGSFGNVYRATIDTGSGNTTTVAVKRLNPDSKQGSHEFWTEVNLLSTFRHSNLISLIGYCVDQNGLEMILVYEYMANGTLADHIYKNNENSSYLSWEQRLKICIGVGRGLEYLHTGTGIDQIVIHRDLKSSNILLDADWAAKISDFGLCKTCSANRPFSPFTASVKGTIAYMDPNYCTTHKLSRKTDVYAFGIVLLEVLCGRGALDHEVADRQKRLAPWAQQCIREGVVHRIIDPGLWGRISDDGLQIFLDITLECLHDRPNKRPTMVEVVAKLVSALTSQYTTYSSSSVDDEFVKIFFGHASCLSSSANSDVDPVSHAVENGSVKSDTVKQDPGSESSISTFVRRLIRLKSSSKNNALDVPTDLQSNQVKADVCARITATATSGTSISLSHDLAKDDEYEKLVRRMNSPRVAVDNKSCENATVIKVYGTKSQGALLQVVQVLTDFDLIITKASRTSDGLWFMDVFNVINQEGNKVTDKATVQDIQEALGVYSSSTLPMRGTHKEIPFPNNLTTIELIGNDRPGLLSEVSAILTSLECNVVSAEIWTHNNRIAAVMHISDKETKAAIIEDGFSKIEKLLLIVLKGGNDNTKARVMFTNGCARFDRRLHQMLFADRDYERTLTLNDKKRPQINVVNWHDKDYSAVGIRCKDRPKLLFDIISTLTDLQYFVFHGNVDTEGLEADMEFWIRHVDGLPVKSYAEKQRVIKCLEAAIERRVSEVGA